jgi:hypothetical protein
MDFFLMKRKRFRISSLRGLKEISSWQEIKMGYITKGSWDGTLQTAILSRQM